MTENQKQAAKFKLEPISCVFLALNVLCNNGLNAFIAWTVHAHMGLFRKVPDENFKNICDLFLGLQSDIFEHHFFIAPYLSLYWLMDIVADGLLFRMLLMEKFMYPLVVFKVLTFLLPLVFAIYYMLTWRTVNKTISIGCGFCLFLKAITASWTLRDGVLIRIERKKELKEENKGPGGNP